MKRTLLLLSLVTLPAWSSADELRVLGGKIIKGKVVSITDKEVVIDKETTPLPQALLLDLRTAKGIAAGTKYIDVRLVDDTVLHCRDIAFLGKEVELSLLSDVKFKLPLSYITWFLRDAQDPAFQMQWEKTLKDKVRTDRLVVLNEEKRLQPLEGILGEVDVKAKTIAFNSVELGKRDVLLDNTHGLIFFRPDPPTEAPMCRLFDSQGNTLSASKLTFEKGVFQVTTTFGAKIDIKEDAVARVDFNLGKLAFLSDLEPARVVEKSRLGLVEPYRKDTNLDGQPIQLDRAYSKGLSMHAYTELEYSLQGKYKEFKAIVGIDARVGPSQAKVTIYLDGTPKFSEIVTTKVQPVVMDVKGVGALRIVVTSADFFGLGDHATLADAQVSK